MAILSSRHVSRGPISLYIFDLEVKSGIHRPGASSDHLMALAPMQDTSGWDSHHLFEAKKKASNRRQTEK